MPPRSGSGRNPFLSPSSAPEAWYRGPVIRVAARTDVGMVRRNNEDSYRTDDEQGLVVVADGMGGHRAGEVASRMAVDVIFKSLAGAAAEAEEPEALLGRLDGAVEAANAALCKAITESPDFDGMGTTVVAAIFADHHIYHAHVGDLTRDHSLVQSLVDRGVFDSREQAREAGIGHNVLTRALGIDRAVEVELGSRPVQPGDIYLVCTDGLTGVLDETVIADTLADFRDNLNRAVERLIEQALAGGGHDNVTVVLATPLER
ncbi:MAG: protein phosphatase 2C domain-containing protein [Gammaproteobacteria bacterium]|nr:protein phosphatase 2C domain-containing protein [Gammaproteobacteria bacterium]